MTSWLIQVPVDALSIPRFFTTPVNWQASKQQYTMDHNKCRDLEIDDSAYERLTRNGIDALAAIMSTQRVLLDRLDPIPEAEDNLATVMAYLNTQHHALQDELREFFAALGGVDTHGSAVWKNWKTAHKAAQAKRFKDLTDEELLELHFEVVDLWKFLLNMTLTVGMTPNRLYNLFMAKTAENYYRKDTGY